MAEVKTYTGGCHCGAVRFEAATDPAEAIACNCSHCAKHGLWLTFVTRHRSRQRRAVRGRGFHAGRPADFPVG